MQSLKGPSHSAKERLNGRRICTVRQRQEAGQHSRGRRGARHEGLDQRRYFIGELGRRILVMELYNRNSFIRFHSWQSIFLGIAVIAINLVLGIIPGIGWTIRSLGFLVV